MDSSRTRNRRLSGLDRSLSTRQRYVVTALEMSGDVKVGVTVPSDADHPVEDYPKQVQTELEQMVDETLDVSRLETAVDERGLLTLGRLVLSPGDEEHIEMRVEWDPTFVC